MDGNMRTAKVVFFALDLQKAVVITDLGGWPQGSADQLQNMWPDQDNRFLKFVIVIISLQLGRLAILTIWQQALNYFRLHAGFFFMHGLSFFVFS